MSVLPLTGQPVGHAMQGFNDQELVALSGAHTIGRARPERSGFGETEELAV